MKKKDNTQNTWVRWFGNSLKIIVTRISLAAEKLPFFKKSEALYDNGEDDCSLIEGEDLFARLLYIIMSVYGVIAGFFGGQYLKYLHQCFACYAWGIPLTSRRVKIYSTPNIVVDIAAFMGVYFLIGTAGILLAQLLETLFKKKIKDARQACQQAVAYGFFWLAAISAIVILLPINIYLIGIP